MNTRPALADSARAHEKAPQTLTVVPDPEPRRHVPATTWVSRGIDCTALAIAALLARLELTPTIALVSFGLMALWSTGIHAGRLSPRLSDEIPSLVQRVPLAMVGVGLIGGPAIGLGGVARLSVLVISLTLISRGVFYEVLRKLRIRGHLLESVVLIGSGPIGTELAEAMDEYPECGLNPVGFVDHAEAEGSSLAYLGDITDLPEIMRRVGARRAMFAFGQAREAEMIPIIRKCPPGSHFYVLLRFFELGVDNAPPALRADIGGFPIMQIRPPAPGHPLLLAKRVFDVAASAIALVFLAPIMAGCALAVHRSGPGPILFRQVRVGLDGRPFEILKFRTMHENDDSDVTWSVETDNRVTTAGRILRATHLDEIPQLFNVLRGEMSLVGPRPERPFFVEQFEDEIHGYRDRHRVRSGITGWSQVNGLVGDSSIEERARRDNWYIEHWSLWSDILIILRTIPTMSRRNR